MNLIWLIIKKDIRRERAGLLVWSTLFVAQVAIGYFLLHYAGAGPAYWIDTLQVVSGALAGVQFLFCYALVARLVQADPLQGTDMFWATRPISRGRLLAAKVGAALLVFGLLPVLLRLPWWLGCGFTARDVFWTAVNTLGWQLVVIAPAFLIASLTNEFPRVLLWSLLLFVAGMMGLGVLASLFKRYGIEGEAPLDYAGINYTRIWLMAVLAVLLMGGLAAQHYLTRRLARSLALVAGSLVVVLTSGWFSKANFSEAIANLSRPAFEPGDNEMVATVHAEVGRGYPDPRSKTRRPEVEQTLYTEIYFQGIPPGVSIATAGPSWQSWRWEDGMRIRRSSYMSGSFVGAEALLRETYALSEPARDQETADWYKEKQHQVDADRKAHGVKPPMQWKGAPATQPGTRLLVFTIAPASLSKRALAESPDYEAKLDCVAIKSVIMAELPIRAGARAGSDSLGVHLLSIKPEDQNITEGMNASLVLTAPMIQASGLWFVGDIFPAGQQHALNSLRGRIMSVNRVTGDVFFQGGYSLRASRRAFVAGVLLSWETARIRPSQIIRNGHALLRDPDWINHTSLVVVAEKPVARFPLNLKKDRLEFLSSRWLDSEASASATSD